MKSINRNFRALAWFAFLAAPALAAAQGTQADYDRADSLRGLYRNKAVKTSIDAN